MKKVFLLITALAIGFILIFSPTCKTFAKEGMKLRDYDGIEIPTGSFIPVISEQEISTAYCDEGTKVKFIATNDLYIYETNIIPKDTEFYGYVEKINEPIVGTNASMVIKINKLKLIDGFEIPIHAYIYTSNKNIIGGEMTAPASYDKMAHFQQGLSYGTTQYVPGGTRVMGSHTVIAAGCDLILILTKPAFITHTVTN